VLKPPSRGAGDEEILAGGLMYTLRPNRATKEAVEAVLEKTLRRHCDLDPERTISMPIRGSDKYAQGEPMCNRLM
jgi:hypothetical protein